MPQDDLSYPNRTVFTLRIILFALVMSPAIFACIAVFIVWNQNGPLAPNNDLFTWVLIACAAPMLLLQFVLPPIILNATCRRIMAKPTEMSVDSLLNAYRSHLIIAWSMCEGAAFSVLIGYMLEGNPITLGIAGAATDAHIARARAARLQRPRMVFLFLIGLFQMLCED